MKNKLFLLLAGLLFVSLLQAQVGINTTNPQGIFHIDGAKNTSGTTNVSDDLLVDANGNVGIGTVTSQAKLDVMGNVIITGGSPAANKLLTSDSQGIGSWKEFDRSRGVVFWTVNATGTFADQTDVAIKGTQDLSGTDTLLGFSYGNSATVSSIIVPAGTYLMNMDLDLLNIQEYGQTSIMITNTSNYVYRVFYLEQLSGASMIYAFTTPTEVNLLCRYRTTTGIGRFAVPPLRNATLAAKITFISLTK